ncbi:hypothetical protein TSUD_375300 [Trifolium subterraneum]|uniref:Reverse transcriptase domain-containing protein n=1 Tax=Trifolium subterraneum TaxID=3900 RepID=A0A2Z6MXE2_TRISU|nr:hypothetical protein TSUD_375300 [Trifolium subterraneum]
MAANHGNSPSIQVAMEEIRILQKKVTTMEKERAEQNVDSDDESLIESQPLRQSLWDFKVPDNFKSPHLPTFDGKTDPVEHLMAVGTQTAIIGALEHLRCKLVSGTLKDAALRWYMNLPNNSIESYADFHKKCIHQFSGTKHVKVTATSLFTIRQNYAETLREYLARFSEAMITVSNPNQEMFVAAFHNGLKAGHFNESLAQKPPPSMQEGYRAKPYHPPNSAGVMGYPHYRRHPADREYTPLNKARVHVLHGILQAGLAPLPHPRMHNTIMGPDTEAWCAYHRCKGHDTERKVGEERRAAITEEVAKLKEAGFIEEIKYPTWLANVVMVKKASGKWRMCVDFTDLNKECPKDLYPLPNIDRLIDGASGYKTLSFMDAYSGATYQRLMDRVFVEQIGKNLELYIDDMIVKTQKEGEHDKDLEDILKSFRKYNMRLNPAKCSFGVQAGKLLGFLHTHRGIDANPDKFQAIIDMRSPTSVKEVQQLTGRIAALSRFFSCSGEKACHLFPTLRKSERFTWSPECEEAFQKLKVFLASPLSSLALNRAKHYIYIRQYLRKRSARRWYKRLEEKKNLFTS